MPRRPPALSPRGESVPHGFVFATFMLCCMIGSSCVGAFQGRRGISPLNYMGPVFLLAAAALATPAILHVVGAGGAEGEAQVPEGTGIGAAGRVQMVAFCVFEACVGAFSPSLRSSASPPFLPSAPTSASPGSAAKRRRRAAPGYEGDWASLNAGLSPAPWAR